ncbi:MAG: glycosyltransferase family 4 protein [Eubacteriales bacterium]
MEQQLHIALIATHFAPEVTPITHLYADLAEDLCRYGARVSVVTKLPGHDMTEEERAAFYDRRDVVAGWSHSALEKGVTARSWLSARSERCRTRSPSIVAQKNSRRTSTFFAAKPGRGLCTAREGSATRRGRSIFTGDLPDNLVAAASSTEWHPFVRLCRRMEQHIYRRNHAFITLSDEMKRTLVARGVQEEKIAVIPNWADTNAIQPILREENAMFDECNLPREGFYAVYAGTLGFLQEPDVILDAAKLLKNVLDIRILVFGDGSLRDHVESRIVREQIDNVLLFPLKSTTQIAQIYSLADVVLVPLKKGMTRIAVPSATQLALAAGRPLIVSAEAGSEWARSIERESFGLCITPGEPQEMADAILRLHASTVPMRELGARARNYACEHASREQATQAYFDWIRA